MKYLCPKCHHTECTTGEMRVSGSALASIFDLEGRKFSSVTCGKCKYTEFYQVSQEQLESIFDFFVT